MKQSEINRELNLLLRAEAKKRGWKSVGGMPYWTIGPLFFCLLPLAIAKSASFQCYLSVKWLELDRYLWKVLDMTDNEHAPFSLHANGAFVLSGTRIMQTSVMGLDWSSGILKGQIESSAQEASERSKAIAPQIQTLQTYLGFIEREHEVLVRWHPGAVTNIWVERLLVALATGDLKMVYEIASARIAAGDGGGFTSGNLTFYKRAKALCGRDASS